MKNAHGVEVRKGMRVWGKGDAWSGVVKRVRAWHGIATPFGEPFCHHAYLADGTRCEIDSVFRSEPAKEISA